MYSHSNQLLIKIKAYYAIKVKYVREISTNYHLDD